MILFSPSFWKTRERWEMSFHQPSPGDVVIDELEAHVPFLQPEAAARLLLRVENVLTHSTPVPTSVGLSDKR